MPLPGFPRSRAGVERSDDTARTSGRATAARLCAMGLGGVAMTLDQAPKTVCGTAIQNVFTNTEETFFR